MLSSGFQDCTYTAEVLRTRAATSDIAERLSRLALPPRLSTTIEHDGGAINLIHAFVPSERAYHRSTRTTRGPDGGVIETPQRRRVGRSEQFLYDVLIAQRLRHTILAVPFHGLAEEFFPRADRELAGTRTSYERLDITNIVVGLGRGGRLRVADGADRKSEIGITRCQLAYSDEAGRTRDIQNVRLSGANLGVTEQYQFLIGPVLDVARPGITVTPVVIGFALFLDGVKKANAVTDRHGNFRVFVGPSIRQIVRLFDLLDALEGLEDVVSATVNLPILQARVIREEAGE